MKELLNLRQAFIYALKATRLPKAHGNLSSGDSSSLSLYLKKLTCSITGTILIVACAFSTVQGQYLPGTNDGSFNTADVNFPAGFNSPVTSMILQPDGKIVAGGSFTSYNLTSRNNIARLNTDGTLDKSYNSGNGFDNTVRTLALQADGKVVVGGSFSSFDNISRNHIARLSPDGVLDESFTPGTGFNNTVRSIKLQPDGKIIVAGNFTSYNGTSRNRIARLNTDGSLDESFNPGTGFNAFTQTLALQPDGKIIVGGSFTSFNSTSKRLIVRLNIDGSLDDTFNSGVEFDEMVHSVALQPDGKIILAGGISSFNGTGNRLSRLYENGSPDNSFTSLTKFGRVNFNMPITLQPDGKIIVGEGFTQSSSSSKDISRLNSNGSLDNSFDPGNSFSGFVFSIVLQPDGKIVAGGSFSRSIARLHTDSSPDISYNPGTGFNEAVGSIALQPDGKMVVAGGFTFYYDTPRNHIARLHTNGSLDESFNPGDGFNGFPWSIALQPDGKILAGGGFTAYNGTLRKLIVRLNTDGSLDESFNPNTGLNPASGIASIVLQPDGNIIAGGSFSFYTFPRNNIARFKADGSLDNTFNPGTGLNSAVWSIALQPDGKMVVGGDFTFYNGSSPTNGTSRNRIARLNADGSLDNSFNSGTGFESGFNRTVHTIALQPDGKMIVGGNFTSYNGKACNRIVRLNTDGTLDNSFNPGKGLNDLVLSIVLQPDGKIIVAGAFSSYNSTSSYDGTSRNRIAILNPDGSLYEPFNLQNGFDYGVNSIALQPDGKIVAAGHFVSYNSIIRNRIARIYGSESSQLRAGKELEPEPELLAYPNPTSGDLHLTFDNFKANARAIEVVLYNNIGQPVLKQVVNPEQVQTGLKLRTATFAAGIYYLRVKGEGKTTSKQIVLQR